MSNVQIANIILAQLGGKRFSVMTGAKDFVAVENGLQFKLPARIAKDGINCLLIKLNASDLYDVCYMRVRGKSCKVISESNDVYADDLVANFEESTGLFTHL